MFFKIIYFLLLFIVLGYGSTKNIDKKIDLNKNILKKKKLQKLQTNLKIKELAQAIQKEEGIYNDIVYNLNKVSNNIFLNKIKLQKAKSNIKKLDKEAQLLKENISHEEMKLVNSISDQYAITLSKELIDKKSLKGIIQKEKYELILDSVKENILKSNMNYLKLSNAKEQNNRKKQKLEEFIAQQENEKKRYKKLQIQQQIALHNIKAKHTQYQQELKAIINKQENINKLLTTLNIMKKNKQKEERLTKLKLLKIKQRQARLKKLKQKSKKKSVKKTITTHKKVVDSKEIKISAKKQFQDDINLKVRNIGSTAKGIKISSYRGAKTIAPLKKYTIVKKFGKYYDRVYKIELFNESISLRSKIPNAKVYCVLAGKVVYAKYDAGELGNVVIVKHRGNLHTIYSQLSDIPHSLKQGKWIKKGYVVGRVKRVLVFQATKNNRYVNPEKLFR